jgi:hypothetical protein
MSGDVEIDEIFIQGKQRYKNGLNTKITNIIFGIYSRDTKEVLLFHIPNKSAQSIHPILTRYLEPGTRIYSDKMSTYVNCRSGTSNLTNLGFEHLWTNHRLYYVDPSDSNIHSNSIENIWRQFRHSISHIRRAVSNNNIENEINFFKFGLNYSRDILLHTFLYYSKVYYDDKIIN